MYIKHMLQAGITALALAGLSACQTETADAAPRVVSPGESYRTASDVHFISDADGTIAHQVPLDLLKDIQGQMAAQGQGALAHELEALYDFSTGEVKDIHAAEKAEAFLKANLPSQPGQSPTAETQPPAGHVLRPEDLPAGITIPQEMIESIRRAAAKDGAK
jgi:hypothetical protein